MCQTTTKVCIRYIQLNPTDNLLIRDKQSSSDENVLRKRIAFITLEHSQLVLVVIIHVAWQSSTETVMRGVDAIHDLFHLRPLV